MTHEPEKQRPYGVYSIRHYSKDGQKKNDWLRIGAGFQNRDGSFNILLRALPIPDSKGGIVSLHMRLPKPKTDVRAEDVQVDEEEGFYIEIDPLNGIDLEDL